MSTQYFILTKNPHRPVHDRTHDQLIHVNASQAYLLPEVNLDYYHKHGLFEHHLIEWTKQLCDPSQVFLDIGAHTGTYAISLAGHCQHVYAFEPQKMTYYALCGGVALSHKTNITCCQMALGAEDQVGTTQLNIRSDDGGGSSLHVIPGSTLLGAETVEVRTLDSYQITNIGCIKMDVEENELNVLRGATLTLKNSHYPKILFESNQENRPLFAYLEELGYKIIRMSGCNNMYLAEYHIPPFHIGI